MTRKAKDAGPDGHKKMVSFDGSDEDVEGHQRRVGKDEVGPEGHKKMVSFDGGDDDDVEGHKQHLPK
jgi:hypothetical protein